MMREVPEIPEHTGDCGNFPHLVEKQHGQITSFFVTGSSFDGMMSCSLEKDETARTISHVVLDRESGAFSIFMGDKKNPVPFSETANKNEAWLRMIEAAAGTDCGQSIALFERLADKAAENIRNIAIILTRQDIGFSMNGQPTNQHIAQIGKFDLLRYIHPRTQKAFERETFFLRAPSSDGGMRFSLSPDGWIEDSPNMKAENIPASAFIFHMLSRKLSLSGHERMQLAEALTGIFSGIEHVSDCQRAFKCPRYTSTVLSMRI